MPQPRLDLELLSIAETPPERVRKPKWNEEERMILEDAKKTTEGLRRSKESIRHEGERMIPRAPEDRPEFLINQIERRRRRNESLNLPMIQRDIVH